MHMRALGRNRKFREETGLALCDGKKLFAEALAAGLEIICLLTCDDRLSTGDVPAFLVTPELLAYVSPLKTPQQVLFTCRVPQPLPPRTDGRGVIVLDGVQDPGNLGAILRSADAFRMEQVILLPGTADLYSPKTIRSAMGAVFRQPVRAMDYEELAALLKERALRLVGADLGAEADDPRDMDFSNVAVAIGAEGQGLGETVLSMCRGRVQIPMNAACESLNAGVAASIIMWEIYRSPDSEVSHE